jgi:transposase
MNTKLHAVTDAMGRPISFFMTAGVIGPAILRKSGL